VNPHGAALTETRLNEALEHGELVVFYQPKLALNGHVDGKLEGVEALVRWNDPLYGGLRAPDEFIPLAERTGLIEPLTWYVLDAAIAQTAAWHARGMHFSVSVNLPATMVNDMSLPDRVAGFLGDRGFPSGKLMLEVTETGAMVNSTTTIESLTRLRVKGIGLSIDDFGTGYSSLVELYRMPFSELKIDKSFVLDCDHDPEARTIVEAIVSLAHNLHLSVCAEGVETEQSLRLLRELGCEKAQGYYISRPLSGAALTDFADAFPGCQEDRG
jgi:EAL domain-containing protein (putative c-di-GMP-specific phosphodiesterase class I)